MHDLSSRDITDSMEYVKIVLAKVEQMLMPGLKHEINVYYNDAMIRPTFHVQLSHNISQHDNYVFPRGSCTRMLEIKHINEYNDEELVIFYFNQFEDYFRNAYGNSPWYSMRT